MGAFVYFSIVLTLFYGFSLRCVSTKLLSSENNMLENLMTSYIEKFNNPYLLIVLFSTSDIIGDVSSPSEYLFTMDIVPKIHKPTYIFRYTEFVKRYNNDFLRNIIFRKVDTILIIDDMHHSHETFFPQVFDNVNQTFLVFGYPGKTNFQRNPNSIYLFFGEERIHVMHYKFSQCGDNELVSEIFIQVNNMSHAHTRDKPMPIAYECKINAIFILYSIMSSSWEEQVQFIASHFIYKIFKIISEHLKFQIIITGYSSKNGPYSAEIKNNVFTRFKMDIHSIKIVYNDMHWMSGKPHQMRQLNSNLISFLNSEKIIWLIVNRLNPYINWNYLFTKSLIMVLIILLIIFITMYSTNVPLKKYKSRCDFPQMVILSWSILLGVSVPRQPKQYFVRVLFISWTISSSVLTMCYYCKLLNDLTLPPLNTIKTNNELIKSKIPLYVFSKDYADIAFTNTKDISIKPVEYTHFFGHHGEEVLKNETFIEFVENIIRSGQQSAILLDESLSRKIMSKYPLVEYYSLAEAVTSYSVNFYAYVNTDLTAKIRKKSIALMETGVFLKEQKDYSTERGKSSLKSEDTNIKLFINLYIFIAILYVLAFVIFIWEILRKKFGNSHRPSKKLAKKMAMVGDITSRKGN